MAFQELFEKLILFVRNFIKVNFSKVKCSKVEFSVYNWKTKESQKDCRPGIL